MCSIEDAWPSETSGARAGTTGQSYSRFSQQAELLNRHRGHYDCTGAYANEPEPQLDPQYVRPQIVRQEIAVEPPAPPTPAPTPTPLPPVPVPYYPPAMPCKCRRCLEEPFEMRWWHWLLAVLGTALLAALLVRLWMPRQRTIYRHIGLKV
jgi:hypothetical protein